MGTRPLSRRLWLAFCGAALMALARAARARKRSEWGGAGRAGE